MSDPQDHVDDGSGTPRPAAGGAAASDTAVYPSIDELRA
jgi:hypothetical protein